MDTQEEAYCTLSGSTYRHTSRTLAACFPHICSLFLQVDKKTEELGDLKRRNLLVEDKIEEQKKILMMKMEEVKMQHSLEEGKLEQQIRYTGRSRAEQSRLF